VQMAYSLGLHHDQLSENGGSMEREQNRRIWWTLFTLDQEIASRGGSPTLIDERSLKISTPLPSEQVRNFPTTKMISFLVTGSWAILPQGQKNQVDLGKYFVCQTLSRYSPVPLRLDMRSSKKLRQLD
jgi:hypothetical protein